MSPRRLLGLVTVAIAVLAMMLSPAGSLVATDLTNAVASTSAVEGAAFTQMFPSAVPIGALPSGEHLDVGIGVPIPNAAGLQSFIQATSTPGSPQFRQFLTASQFDAQYAPSLAAYENDEAYFAQYGITVQPSSNHLLLGLSGTPSELGAAFHTSFEQYSYQGATYYGTTGVATLPNTLDVDGTFGLTNIFNARPYYTVAPPSGPSSNSPAGPAAACSGGDTPTEIWDTYEVSQLIAASDEASGETISVVDAFDTGQTPATLTTDINDFDTDCGVAAVTPQYQYPVPFPAGENTSASSGWGDETALDMQWSHAMGQKATLKPVQTPDSGFSLYSGVNYLVANEVSNVISLSWGFPDVGIASGCTASEGCNASTGGVYAIFHPVLMAAVAEGISVTVASGDCGAADGSSTTSTDYPSSDEDATGIGGSVLTLASNKTWYGSETGWSGNLSGSSCDNAGGAGGGWSPNPMPWYQSGPGVKYKGLRGSPDVGITVGSPLATYINGGGAGVYGTSDGAPQWAGLIATADGIAGKGIGLINPDLYAMLRSPDYKYYFHNYTGGNNGYACNGGWSACGKGVGTPDAWNVVPYLATGGYTVSLNSLQVALGTTATSGSTPLTVTFSATATGGTGVYPHYNFYWGDGTSIETRTNTLAHTYKSAGTYAAQVEVYDSSGNSTTSTAVMITVGTTPTMTLALAASTATPSVGQSVTFTATTTGGTSPYTFGFYFGDGTWVFGGYNSKQTSPDSVDHAFEQAGTYCADATANDSSSPQQGATSNTVTINVGGATGTCPTAATPLTAVITGTPTTGTAPVTVSFNSTVAGGTPGYTWNWYFEAGQTSSARNPTFTYTTAGTFHAWLNVTDSASGTATSNTVAIVVSAASSFTVSATGTPTTGSAPLTVGFTSSVSGGTSPYTYAWTFGDGSPAGTTANPSHTYTTAGTYSASVTVTDSASHVATSNSISITVSPAPLSITASGTPTSGAAPLTVSFSSTPSGGVSPYTYAWTFGGGGTSVLQNPSYTYGAAGSYSASVVVTDSTTATATSNSILITVTGSSSLTVAANSNRTSSTVGMPISFTSTPSGGTAPYTYAWAFGDGGTSTLADPAYAYSAAGTYSASVTVTDSASHTALSNSISIVVSAVPSPLAITASFTPTSPTAGSSVSFASAPTGGTGTYDTFAWSFSDGGTASTQDATHTFASAGTYTASVTVTDSSGSSATSNLLSITVGSPAKPSVLTLSLSASPTSVSTGTSVTFTATAGGGTPSYTYTWSGLPDGCNGADSATITCAPTQAGTSLIVVEVTDKSSPVQEVTKELNFTVTSGASSSSSGLSAMDEELIVVGLIVVVAAVVLAVALTRRKKKEEMEPPPISPYAPPS